MNPNDTSSMLFVLQVAAPAIPFFIAGLLTPIVFRLAMISLALYILIWIAWFFFGDATLETVEAIDKSVVTGTAGWSWNLLSTIGTLHGIVSLVVSVVAYFVGLSVWSRKD